MKPQDLQAEFDRISSSIRKIKSATGDAPDEVIAMACQHTCVQICGSLEQCLKRIFVEYARSRSDRKIFRPIEKVCESYQNPKSAKVLELVGLFDSDYEKTLKRFWEAEGSIEMDHLNNLVDDRITIAHRKRPHLNVSAGKLEDYFRAYKKLVTRVYDHFLGQAP